MAREYNNLDMNTHTHTHTLLKLKEAQVKVPCPLSIASKMWEHKNTIWIASHNILSSIIIAMQTKNTLWVQYKATQKPPNEANKVVEGDETFKTNNMHMHIIKPLWSEKEEQWPRVVNKNSNMWDGGSYICPTCACYLQNHKFEFNHMSKPRKKKKKGCKQMRQLACKKVSKLTCESLSMCGLYLFSMLRVASMPSFAHV